MSIPHAGVAIAGMDTAIALLAGLAIFPVLFAFGVEPTGGGPGLIFTTLPMAFGDMWGGAAYGLAFFALLSVAAWTSSISLLEPPTAYLVERTPLTRSSASILAGLVVWGIGIVTLLGFNVWSEIRVGGRDIQGAIEFVASDIMLPLGGLLVSLYAGWVLDSKLTRKELPQLSDGLYTAWRWSVRVVAPLLVLFILSQKFAG